jgi:hypothetical protein
LTKIVNNIFYDNFLQKTIINIKNTDFWRNKMLSFYEMLRLMENIEGNWGDGDTGHTPLEPIVPRKPVIRRRGTQREEDIAHRDIRVKPSKAMIDYGRKFDGPTVGVGHFPKLDSGFKPGAAIPASGHLTNQMKDITSTGKPDVSAENNPTSPSLKVKQSVGYSSQNSEWEKMLDDKLDFIASVQEVTPEYEKLEPHITNLLKWNRELRKHPGISPNLKEKTYQVDDMIMSVLEKEARKAPTETSAMAKYMLKKHSKVF